MTDPKPEDDLHRSNTGEMGNFGVTAGAIIVLVCCFLPWVALGEFSALSIGLADVDTAWIVMDSLGLYFDPPHVVAKGVFFVPLMALFVLYMDLSARPGTEGRMTANVGMSAASGGLTIFMVFLGVTFGEDLSYGFWGALTGSLFMSVGVGFNVIRGE